MSPKATPGHFVDKYVIANVPQKFTGRAVLCGCPIMWDPPAGDFTAQMSGMANNLIQGTFSTQAISVPALATFLGYPDLGDELVKKEYQITLPGVPNQPGILGA